jgi:hypothetical protein
MSQAGCVFGKNGSGSNRGAIGEQSGSSRGAVGEQSGRAVRETRSSVLCDARVTLFRFFIDKRNDMREGFAKYLAQFMVVGA